jgi:hypothetical protein
MERDRQAHAGSLNTLSCAYGTLVAGGRELVWRRGEHGARAHVDGGTVQSLVLGGGGDAILYASALGRLFRRRSGSAAEICDGWLACADITASRAVSLELSQPSAAAPDSVLLRTSNGRLLFTPDFGTSFFRVPTPGTVLALSQRSTPAWVLIETSGRLLLAEVDLTSRALHAVALDRSAEFVARGQAPQLCASGSIVAIADETRGVAISYDAGRSFSLISGTSSTSACTAGEQNGAPCVWLSVLEESTGKSWIVRVASGRAERIAELDTSPGGVVEESSDNVRVCALCWDSERALLWGVGGFGVVSWCLPKAGNE